MGAQLTIVLSSIQCSNFVFSFVYMNHNAQSVILLASMPPRRAQSYPERAAKRRRVVDHTTAAPDQPGHPHPSLLQPVQSGSPASTQGAPAPTQLALSPEMLSTLSNNIASAVTRALKEVVQAPPSVPSAIPGIQFVPDPTVGDSAPVNGGSDIAETNLSPRNTDRSVQQTVDSAVQQVTGSLFPCEVVSPPSKNTFLSSAVPLTHRVPDKVKKQIWANEYVDFAILLNSNLTQSDEHYTFRVEKGEGGKPALTLAPNPKRQTVQSIDQWVSAFQVFVAIYSEKVPHDTPALMKYGSVIRELATLGANWKFYDENFRSIRQTQGAPWDQIHAELWLRSHSFRDKLSPQTGKSKQTGQRIPKGFCWKFHRGVSCPGCSWCGNNHPISKCQQSYSKPPAGNSGTKPTGSSYATSNRSPTTRSTPNPGQG